MKLTLNDVKEFQDYFNQVMEKADHHAPNVDDIILAVAGAVILTANEIKVLEKEGKMKNALWFKAGDNRYALSYVRKETGSVVELKENNLQGDVIASFNNATPVREIKQVFESLSEQKQNA